MKGKLIVIDAIYSVLSICNMHYIIFNFPATQWSAYIFKNHFKGKKEIHHVCPESHSQKFGD